MTATSGNLYINEKLYDSQTWCYVKKKKKSLAKEIDLRVWKKKGK